MENLFKTAETKPWLKAYPKPPADYVWEPITVFAPLVCAVLAVTGVLTAVLGRKLKGLDKIMLGFMILSGIIHFGLERYWVVHNAEILDQKNTHILARLWRHFGASDTRWWGPQPGVDPAVTGCIYGIEWLAAYLCGPTIVLAIVLAAVQSPLRWVVTPVSVTAQAYGLFITWIPAYWENLRSVPKDDPVLWYGYFWGWQLPWFVLPFVAIIQAGIAVSNAARKARALDAQEALGKTN
jgi:hypothetical protein